MVQCYNDEIVAIIGKIAKSMNREGFYAYS